MRNILVMGAGLIGSRHIAAVSAHSGCHLAGVVDPDRDRVTSPEVLRYQSLDDVHVPVDGVIIATPTHLHHTNGIAAARRGWHMLIEKPVAETVANADALSKVADENNVRCLIGHHRRYHQSIRMLKECIARGDIGDPITSSLIWAVRKPDSYFETQWRKAGGSPVMINLIHDVDLLRFVLGEVEDISGFASQGIRRADRIESGAVALRFASGLCATISFADTAPSPWGFEAATAENPNIATTRQDMWWITGTKGGISFPSMSQWGGAHDWSEAPSLTKTHTDEINPLNTQLNHFLDVINGDADPIISLQDARNSLQITQEIEQTLYQSIPA